MKKTSLICLLIAILLVFTACNKGYDSTAESTIATFATDNYAAMDVEEAAEEYYADEDIAWDDVDYGMSYGSFTNSDGETKSSELTGVEESLTEKIIYSASMEMETTEYDQAVAAIKSRVEQSGGYIENSSMSDYGNFRYAYFAIRVPAEQYRYFCDTAGEIGSIRSFNENVQNISETYYDTASRLDSAKARMEALQELMKKAEDMEDIITIQNAISDCQYDIDYYSGTLRRYDAQVRYSTITINLNEVSRITDPEQPAIGFGQELKNAFKRGGEAFVEFFRYVILSIARHFILWAIFIAIVVFIIVKVKKYRKNRRIAASAAWQPQPEVSVQQEETHIEE